MDESVSSAVGDGRTGVRALGPELSGIPQVPPPRDRARYQPLRGLEELLDDFLHGPAESN